MANLNINSFPINNENNADVLLRSNKNGDTFGRARKTFGELKNVIHNQQSYTPVGPFKSNIVNDTKSLRKHVLDIQHQNKIQQFSTQRPRTSIAIAPKTTTTKVDDFDPLDYFDMNRQCCKKPYKSEQQIWSEMDPISDEFIDNICKTLKFSSVDEGYFDGDYDLEFSKVHDEDIEEHDMLFNYTESNDGFDSILADQCPDLPCFEDDEKLPMLF